MLFVNAKGHVLLLLRDDVPTIPFPNRWDLPGGHVEDGETPEECIRREMLEEIEYDLGAPRLFGVYDLADHVEHAFWHRADFDPARIPLHEGQRLQWFSEEEIRRLEDVEVAFGFKGVVLDFFRRAPWR